MCSTWWHASVGGVKMLDAWDHMTFSHMCHVMQYKFFMPASIITGDD
jgi:hypothetical protein